MDANERRVIDELFGKLEVAERQGGPRDAEAEALIGERLRRQPAAPYYMAQAIVFQEEALRQTQGRIQELEAELAARPAGGGFLGGLFGGGEPAQNPRTRPQPSPMAAYRERPGFLGGAMQTALAVTGGVMLGSFLASMISGGGSEAAAAEAMPADLPPDEGGADYGDGFDSGWGGGFDDSGGLDF